MQNQIVQIGRHRFVSGLFWQSLSRRRELRKEALELAGKLNFDLLMMRIDRDVAEAGFANSREGAQAGLLSLGAMVSKAISIEGALYDGRQQPAPNWLGAFKTPDGRWAYFAVRDNLFLPNGDWLGTRDEVFDRLIADYALGGWNVVIGDAEVEGLGFHNFYPRTLEDLLPRRNGKPRISRWWAVQPVRRGVPRTLVALGAAAAVLLVASFGYVKYREHMRELEFERVAALMRQQAAAHGGPAIMAAPHLPHPWASQPAPSQLLRACVQEFGDLSPGGWQLDEYSCTQGAASYVWSRNGSTIGYLLASLPNAQVDGSGDRAALRLPLAMPPGDDEPLEPAEAMRVRMLEAFQPLGIDLKLDVVQQRDEAPVRNALVQQLPGAAKSKSLAPDWRTWRVSANLGGIAPADVAPLFDQPGVRLDKVTFHNGAWSVEGEIYAK